MADTVELLSDILAQVERGTIAPLYYLCGETYPIDQVVRAVRRQVLGEKENAFNYDLLSADEAQAGGILDAARTLPMFGPRKVVLARDLQLLEAEELNRLLPYVKDPAPSTVLLLLAEKADLRLKFFGELKKHGVLAKFEPLRERQAAGWVAAEARRLKIELRPGAAESIAEAVGTDMAQLASALERVSLFAGPGRAVEPSQVDELLLQTRQRSIFELTNAVGRGRRREALLVLRKMLQDREPGVRIVTMLARHLRQLWSARELTERGQSKGDIASALGIHPYFVGDMLEQARKWSVPVLRRTHRALFEADRRLKSSRLADAIILEQLVLALCPAAGGRDEGS